MNIIDLGIWKADRSYGLPNNFPKDAAIPPENAMWWRRESDGIDWRMFSQKFDPNAIQKWTINNDNLPVGKLLVTLIEVEPNKWLTQGIFRDYSLVGMPTRTKILLIDDLYPEDTKPHKLYEQKLYDEINKTFVIYKPPVYEIPRHQGLLALLVGANITEQTIRNKINEETDLIKRETMRIRFESQTWSRNSEFILWGMSVFNLSSDQVDQLFKLAATF